MSPKTILFLGATGGVALSTLRRALAAGHTCIALCRTPSTLTTKLALPTPPPNLYIHQGNAHDVAALTRCLLYPTTPTTTDDTTPSEHKQTTTRLPDIILTSLGARPTLTGMSDPHVCETGMSTLLSALQHCRSTPYTLQGTPHIVAISTTGISSHGRDIPLLMVPLYKVLLATAHEDKKKMEGLVVESGERWTVVRGSLYVDCDSAGAKKVVRVGVEDLVRGVVESTAVGYTISREEVGRWVFEEVVEGGEENGGRWVGKAVTVTF